LPTKDHFSSNWASWLAGGKSHEFVVAVAGVLAGSAGVAYDGVFIDAGQARGLADATAVAEVHQDGEGLVVGQARGEESGAFAFGEALLAGAASEQTALLLTVAEADT
jgi:hypothetical protein